MRLHFLFPILLLGLNHVLSGQEMRPSSTIQNPDRADRGEALAVVVHKSNPVDSLTIEELQKFCLAERRHWPGGNKITIVLREPGQPERETVLKYICQMTEMEYTRHFLQSTFTGQVQAKPRQLATATGVRRFVFNVPGAFGFMRVSDVDDSVKVVRLNGHLPTDPEYKLRLPAKEVRQDAQHALLRAGLSVATLHP